MYKNEVEFEKAIIEQLESQGYVVERNFRSHLGYDLDLFGQKDDRTYSLEIKMDAKQLFDALSLASQYRRLTEVDESYIVIPEKLLTDELKSYASQLGVGIMILGKEELQIVVRGKSLPIGMDIGVSCPSKVIAGSEFHISIIVSNVGRKTLLNTEVNVLEAYPFKFLHETTSKVVSLPLGKSNNFEFAVRAFRNTKAGIYPIFYNVKSDRVQTYRSTIPIKVESEL